MHFFASTSISCNLALQTLKLNAAANNFSKIFSDDIISCSDLHYIRIHYMVVTWICSEHHHFRSDLYYSVFTVQELLQQQILLAQTHTCQLSLFRWESPTFTTLVPLSNFYLLLSYFLKSTSINHKA